MLGRFSHPNNLRADGADLSSHRWDRCRDVNGKSPVIWSEAFCVFNNWLSFRALVSLMISSNLLTLHWIFLQRPQCAIRKTTNKRGFSSAGGILGSTAPYLPNVKFRVKISLYLSNKGIVQDPKGLAPFSVKQSMWETSITDRTQEINPWDLQLFTLKCNCDLVFSL